MRGLPVKEKLWLPPKHNAQGFHTLGGLVLGLSSVSF
jgi:hypothetical protein